MDRLSLIGFSVDIGLPFCVLRLNWCIFVGQILEELLTIVLGFVDQPVLARAGRSLKRL